MTRQTKYKPTADQTQANAYFGTFAFLQRDRQTQQNAKEPKFTDRTATANTLSTGSVSTYKCITTQNQNNKTRIFGGQSPPNILVLKAHKKSN